MRLSLTLSACLLVSLCTAALGAFTWHSEESALPGRGEIALLGQFGPASGQGIPIGLSSLTNKNGLDLCVYALRFPNSLEMRYLPDQVRDQIPSICDSIARAATASTPTSSYAWAMGAMAAARMDNWPEFNRRVALSQTTGATERWVASLRAEIAFSVFDHLDDTGIAANRSDIALLLQSVQGGHDLADQYLARPQVRQHIETVVEGMPEVNQRRFVSVVQAASKGQ